MDNIINNFVPIYGTSDIRLSPEGQSQYEAIAYISAPARLNFTETVNSRSKKRSLYDSISLTGHIYICVYREIVKSRKSDNYMTALA